MQVGLVTYGTHVQVYELGFAECSKSYVFKGSKEYTPAQVAQQLGIVGSVRSGPPGQPGAGGAAGGPHCCPVMGEANAALHAVGL